MAVKVENIGPVTAYGAATDTEHGGTYTGTYEDFCTMLADLGNIAQALQGDLVHSFNGRKGDVMPQAGDYEYSADQITVDEDNDVQSVIDALRDEISQIKQNSLYQLTVNIDDGVQSITISPSSSDNIYLYGTEVIIMPVAKSGYIVPEVINVTIDSNKTVNIVSEEIPALRFGSDEDFTLSSNKGKCWNGTIEYSTDEGNTWSIWNGTDILSGTSDQPVYLRGSNNTVVARGGAMLDGIFVFTGKYCTGNIETLLDYQTVANREHPTMDYRCCCGLFAECTSLVVAPRLSAITLAEECYEGMFSGCTSLIAAPDLPATILEPMSYAFMFSGCTSLTVPPRISATTLAKECCRGMFSKCSSLTTAPQLPATILAEGCYRDMFERCSSLTTASQLPATTLAKNCYYRMFNDCPSLLRFPKLPATILAESCYEQMFRKEMGTSSRLSETQTEEFPYPYRIPTEGTGIEATYSLDSMFIPSLPIYTPTINTTYYVKYEPV